MLRTQTFKRVDFLLSVKYSIFDYRYNVEQQVSRTYSSSLRLWLLTLRSLSPKPLAATTLLLDSMTLTILDISCKWRHLFFVFLHLFFCDWLIFLSIMPSTSLHVTNDRISIFLRLSNIPLYVSTTVSYSFIHWWTFRLFPHLGYCE